MFRKQKPQAIPGDPVGEALVQVRDRIEKYGWKSGGGHNGPHSPMCLGNHIAVVVNVQAWNFLDLSSMGKELMRALGFTKVEWLYRWNDSFGFGAFFGRWEGKRASLRRINNALEFHNHLIECKEITRAAREAIDMDIGKPVREIEAPAPVEIPIEEPEVEKEPEREPEKVPA